MHGQRETSYGPRVTCTLVHGAFLIFAAWLYFGAGDTAIFQWFSLGEPSTGSFARRVVLFSFGVMLFLRMSLEFFYLLKRKFGWDELGGVLFALLVYQVGFALMGVSTSTGIGIVDIVAIVMFVIGSYLNTGSELQRKKFKENPANKGRLYTEGLFGYARHINYLGDILWVTAWAIVTRNVWATAVPVALTAGFTFAFIPSLSRHLQRRYGEQYEEWAKTTKALIPFIY